MWHPTLFGHWPDLGEAKPLIEHVPARTHVCVHACVCVCVCVLVGGARDRTPALWPTFSWCVQLTRGLAVAAGFSLYRPRSWRQRRACQFTRFLAARTSCVVGLMAGGTSRLCCRSRSLKQWHHDGGFPVDPRNFDIAVVASFGYFLVRTRVRASAVLGRAR